MTAHHPYEDVADHQLWYRAVTWAPPGALDPVVRPRFEISHADRIATMGSCFAQHLSRHLVRAGLHYFVPEQAPAGMPADVARARQYGAFSARYGNVYTAAQAEQLVRRAYGEFTPDDEAWERSDGALADPFRPLVEPDGFGDLSILQEDRIAHLAAVRSVLEQSDVLVFTLGLTEAWRSRVDGAVFPTAPGVNAGSYDPRLHEFVNFDVDEVRRSLSAFCDAIHAINPRLRLLLTVSPVPLVATYEPRHVLVSTTYSKSVLRVAAEAALDQFSFVDYFPSYEIISSASAARNYYQDDLRDVVEDGVGHVMRSFTKHYVSGQAWSGPRSSDLGDLWPIEPADTTCDEETVIAAIEATR